MQGMTFKKGQSGNPVGRRKGALSKRVLLAKLLEPHAQALVGRLIELALSGDGNALRICIERLIPKIRHEPVDIDLYQELHLMNPAELRGKVLRVALDGQMCLDDAERLMDLINKHCDKVASTGASKLITSDPVEAARIYQRVMQGE
jgi:hypothetical protein